MRHFGTQYCNNMIKRYWDKKIILSHMFQWPTKVSSKKTYLELFYLFIYLDFFVKSLPWPLDIHGSKIFFYRNIFLSHYCAAKCLVWIRANKGPFYEILLASVTWALSWEISVTFREIINLLFIKESNREVSHWRFHF